MKTCEVKKTWLAKNGWKLSCTVATVGIIILASVGIWRFSSNNEIKNRESVSLSYSAAIAHLNSEGKEARAKVQTFINDYHDHHYSVLAAIQLAKAEIDAKNLEEGLTQLRWARDKTEDIALLSLINLRIARIHKERGDFEKAIAITKKIDSDGWKGYVLELRGDIELARGRREAAYFFYTEAQQEKSNSQILQLKLDDIKE